MPLHLWSGRSPRSRRHFRGSGAGLRDTRSDLLLLLLLLLLRGRRLRLLPPLLLLVLPPLLLLLVLLLLLLLLLRRQRLPLRRCGGRGPVRRRRFRRSGPGFGDTRGLLRGH